MRMRTEVRSALDALKADEQDGYKDDEKNEQEAGVFGEKVLDQISQRVLTGSTDAKSVQSHNGTLDIREKANNVTILGLLDELSRVEIFTKSYEQALQKQGEKMISKKKQQMVSLTRQVE